MNEPEIEVQAKTKKMPNATTGLSKKVEHLQRIKQHVLQKKGEELDENFQNDLALIKSKILDDLSDIIVNLNTHPLDLTDFSLEITNPVLEFQLIVQEHSQYFVALEQIFNDLMLQLMGQIKKHATCTATMVHDFLETIEEEEDNNNDQASLSLSNNMALHLITRNVQFIQLFQNQVVEQIENQHTRELCMSDITGFYQALQDVIKFKFEFLSEQAVNTQQSIGLMYFGLRNLNQLQALDWIKPLLQYDLAQGLAELRQQVFSKIEAMVERLQKCLDSNFEENNIENDILLDVTQAFEQWLPVFKQTQLFNLICEGNAVKYVTELINKAGVAQIKSIEVIKQAMELPQKLVLKFVCFVNKVKTDFCEFIQSECINRTDIANTTTETTNQNDDKVQRFSQLNKVMRNLRVFMKETSQPFFEQVDKITVPEEAQLGNFVQFVLKQIEEARQSSGLIKLIKDDVLNMEKEFTGKIDLDVQSQKKSGKGLNLQDLRTTEEQQSKKPKNQVSPQLSRQYLGMSYVKHSRVHSPQFLSYSLNQENNLSKSIRNNIVLPHQQVIYQSYFNDSYVRQNQHVNQNLGAQSQFYSVANYNNRSYRQLGPSTQQLNANFYYKQQQLKIQHQKYQQQQFDSHLVKYSAPLQYSQIIQQSFIYQQIYLILRL